LGCCPFHDDPTPSFTIYDGGQRFHCFGCEASGDVLDLVQRIAGVGLVEAARMLGAGEGPAVQPVRGVERLQPADGDSKANRALDLAGGHPGG
jgi:DNA primase